MEKKSTANAPFQTAFKQFYFHNLYQGKNYKCTETGTNFGNPAIMNKTLSR